MAAVPLRLPGPGQAAAQDARDRLVRDLDGLVARLERADSPLLVVLAGGTGAGKSTVANTLAGRRVAATGVRRPTTSAPTLLAHPEDLPALSADRVLPGLVRRPEDPDASAQAAGGLHVAVVDRLPEGVALVDAPDVDSVATANRDLAEVLLDAADVWTWFATARTYADAEGMAYLRRAARRRTALVVVLTQVRDADRTEVEQDFRRTLAEAGLDGVDLHVVASAEVVDERLPEAAVAGLRAWLERVAEPAARTSLRAATIAGAVADLPHEAERLLDAVGEEARTAARLEEAAERAYGRALERFAEELEGGLPLRTEVLRRWSDLVGTGRMLRLIESTTGRVRGWVRDLLADAAGTGATRVDREVRVEVADALADAAVAVLDVAAAEAATAWESEEAGRALLADDPGLRRAAPDLSRRAAAAVEAWQAHVVELVATRGAARKVRARWLSTAVNAVATTAILVLFAASGGITGAEAGIAAAASAASQALLVSLLGEQNLRWLLERVRADLDDRVARLAAEEQAARGRAVAAVAPPVDAAPAVTAALTRVAAAR